MPGLILRGRVAAALGHHVDTDMIYPGRYLNITDREKTPEHLFELAYPDLRARLGPGAILVAGRNFGCGSSREQAAAAIRYAGVQAVLAASFARIFFRNAINLGLPAVVCAETARIAPGDELEIDLEGGLVTNRTQGVTLASAPLDPQAVALLEAGGLVPYLKKKYAA